MYGKIQQLVANSAILEPYCSTYLVSWSPSPPGFCANFTLVSFFGTMAKDCSVRSRQESNRNIFKYRFEKARSHLEIMNVVLAHDVIEIEPLFNGV